LIVAGAFTTIDGLPRASLARLSAPVAALQSLDLAGNTVTWMRSGSGSELALAPILEFSVAGSLYVPLGSMQRIANGWQYGGYAAPIGQSFFLRVQAAQASGYANSSSTLLESTRWLKVSDAIFSNGFE
jgi:hypothetical protein